MAVTVARTAAGYICLSRIRGEKLMRKLQQAARDLPTVLEKTTNQGELHEKDLEQITGGANSVRF